MMNDQNHQIQILLYDLIMHAQRCTMRECSVTPVTSKPVIDERNISCMVMALLSDRDSLHFYGPIFDVLYRSGNHNNWKFLMYYSENVAI
jgi:hypothetical protein